MVKDILFRTYADYKVPGKRVEIRTHYTPTGAEDFFKIFVKYPDDRFGRVWVEDKSGNIIFETK
jgi:hypothetical protein